jgi:hypothetical protein
MRNTLFIFCFCMSFLGYAQDTLSKWSWGVIGGAEVCGRQMKILNNDPTTLDAWNSIEKNVLRLSGGMRVQRQISERISLYSGLSYVNRGYRIDTLQDAGLNSLNYHFRYLNIPMGVTFASSGTKRNALLGSVAITGLVGVGNKLYYYKDGQTARFEMQAVPVMNRYVMNVSAALGVRRTISNTANLCVYVCGDQALSPAAQASFERRLYSLGLYLTVMNSF